jgi:hypothetical protein
VDYSASLLTAETKEEESCLLRASSFDENKFLGDSAVKLMIRLLAKPLFEIICPLTQLHFIRQIMPRDYIKGERVMLAN